MQKIIKRMLLSITLTIINNSMIKMKINYTVISLFEFEDTKYFKNNIYAIDFTLLR